MTFDVNIGERAWIGILMVLVVVLSWIRNLNELAYFSMVANVCIFITLVIILYEEITSFVYVSEISLYSLTMVSVLCLQVQTLIHVSSYNTCLSSPSELLLMMRRPQCAKVLDPCILVAAHDQAIHVKVKLMLMTTWGW